MCLVLVIWGGGACGDTIPSALGESDEDDPCLPSAASPVFPDLLDRSGPPARTTGRVPHQQVDPDGVPGVIDAMARQIFALPDVEGRPSLIVETATAIWLRNEVNLARPECLVAQREVGHIHQDELDLTLPHGRIPGAETGGWIEQHPCLNRRTPD